MMSQLHHAKGRKERTSIQKLTRLPDNARIHKRPLLRPPIPSPYAGKQNQKVVYISSKTPFMSAFKRVKQLLKQADKREMQSSTSNRATAHRRSHKVDDKALQAAEREQVLIKATGKAIDKALNIGLFLQAQNEYVVKVKTQNVDAIDDIELGAQSEAHEMDHDKPEDDLPESRIRHAPMIEISVNLT